MLYDRRKALSLASRTLLQAAEIVDRRGHCQWQFENSRRRVCLIGALRFAAKQSSDARFEGAVVALRRFLQCDIMTWNNRPGRTKEQVVEALETAAWSER
jgi:hypothetical protein